MDLSVITVTWNSEELIGEQIRSVAKGAVDLSYEQIIIDNASSDKTVPYIQTTFPDYTSLQMMKIKDLLLPIIRG